MGRPTTPLKEDDMEENKQENKNPWLSIWMSPRETIARVVSENPNRSIWWLAFIYGFSSLLNLFQSMTLGKGMGVWGILILAVILAAIYGYVSFSIWSWVVTWTGKLFKGQGTYKTIRASYAWSCVPLILNIPLWLLMVALFGHQLFLNLPDAYLLSGWKVFVLFVVLIAKVILAIWSLVIYINALAEVQKYSVVRSILNMLVAGIVLGIIFFVLWSLLAFAAGGMAVGPTLYKPF